MVGEIVSHYRILAKLGEGGMGVVYEAEDLRLRRTVALKFLPSDIARDHELRERFIREAQAAAVLDHANVCTVYEIDETADNKVFIAMARCQGESVADRLSRGPVPVRQALRIALQVARGLEAAHELGIVHRDVKPTNIMVAPNGEAKVLDFGIAKLAGERPFAGDTPGQVLNAIYRDPPRELVLSDPLADEVRGILARCLAKRPIDRYPSVAELRYDLETLIGTPPENRSPSRPLAVPQRWRTRPVEILATIAVIVFIASALFMWRKQDTPGGAPASAIVGRVLAILTFENMAAAEDTERLGQILQELIITDLSEVPSLRVISSQRLLDIQRQLGFSDRQRIDRDLASEVSRVAGAKAMLCGSILQIGDAWMLSSQLIDVASGAAIRSQKIRGSDIYTMVDELSREIRRDLGLDGREDGYVDVGVRDRTTYSMDAFRHYLAGVDYLNASSFDRAIGELRQAVDIDPGFALAYYKLGLAEWWSDDVSTGFGRASIARILENEQQVPPRERMLARGALAMIDRRFTDARLIYEEMVGLYPDDKEVYFVLGLAYEYESNLNRDQANAAFERAIELDITFTLAYRGIYDMCTRSGDFVRAYEMARNLVTYTPDNPVGYRFLTEAALCKGDTAQFRAALKLALTHHPEPEDRQWLYYHIGLVGNRIHDNQLSERYTHLALEASPETADARIFGQLGDAYFNRSRYAEAEHYYAAGMERNPLSSWCLGGLWYVAMGTRAYDDAIGYAERLVAMRPQSPRRYGELVLACEAAGRRAKADSVLEAGLAAIPSANGRAGLLTWVATSDYSDEKYERYGLAMTRLERAAAALADTSDPKIRGSMVRIAAAIQDYDAVKRHASVVLARRPEDQTVRSLLGTAFLYTGESRRALELAHECVRSRPQAAWSYGLLVEVLIALGRHDEADSVVTVALARDERRNQKLSILFDSSDEYRRRGHFDRAEAALLQAAAIAPDDNTVKLRVGYLYEVNGRLAEADVAYGAVAGKSVHDQTAALRGRGRVALRDGRAADAEQWFGRALEVDRGHPDALRELAVVLAGQERWDEAAALIELALAERRTFHNLAVAAWILTASEHDIERGRRLAQEALETPPALDPVDEYLRTEPWLPLPQHTLGLAALESGDPAAASEWLEAAQALRPADERIAADLTAARAAVRTASR